MKFSLFIITFLAFGSTLSQDLEEAIYLATETFNSQRSPTTYSTLLKTENTLKKNLVTKDHYFAYLFLLINKANYLDNSNKQTKAIQVYEDALQLYNTQQLNTIFKYDITEYCLKPLGILYNKIGDYTNAENTIKHYIFLAEKKKNNKHRISGAINLAQLYYTIGNYKAAIKIAKAGLQLHSVLDTQKQKLKRIITNCSIKTQNINETKIVHSNPDNETQYQLALKNKDYKLALHYFQLKHVSLKKELLSVRDKAKLEFEEAQLHYKLNDFKNSSKQLQLALKTLLPNYNSKTLPKQEDLYAENTFIDIFDLLARLQTNYKKSLSCYDLSFYVSNVLTKNLTSQEAKLMHLSNNRKRSESCISLLYDQYTTNKDSTLIVSAFKYAEKNKASVLKETIGKTSLLQLHPKDSLLIQEQIRLQEQERLTNKLIKAQYQQDAKLINSLSQDLLEVSQTLKQLNHQINLKYSGINPSEVSIKKLQQKLAEDQAILIEYFYGETTIFQFKISAKAIAFFKIKKTPEFETAITNYITYFDNSSNINNNITKYTTDAYQLYQLLGFNHVKGQPNVIVIADSFLNFIPFETLLNQQTSTQSFSKMPFVAKTQVLAYNTSALFYLNQNPFIYSNKVLGVFPVFENTNTTLTHSLKEAESIKKNSNAKFLMYNKATKNEALQQAKNYDVLHLSTHANSGTFRIPANIDFIDQKLFLNELYSLKLNNNLVVLSACETGIGRLHKGEGSMNLPRGFQYAGIDNILFSLWKINDLSTSQVMASFYKHYKSTHSAFVANHLSKIDYLNNKAISNIKKSPYYWSPFIYYGAVTAKNNTYNLNYLLFTFVGMAIALLLYFVIRKR
ncbi:CHAT domain-containing protein [Olleya aquimaris]|nr:CHAT domain-containing protein [Olleya aquimaris]